MPTETPQIMEAAEKLSQMIADHPATAKYKAAQKSVTEDADASRLLADFDQMAGRLIQQEQSGMPVSDIQRQQLENLQAKIVSHLKIKNLNLAQVEFIDLLRKVNQTIQRPLTEASGAGAAAGRGAIR